MVRSGVNGPQGVEAVASFVTSAVCRECHVEAFADWQGSHHDLAMQAASNATVLGDFADASFSHRGVDWRFQRRGDDFVVRTQGPDGESSDFRVEFAFGVAPLQQYLVALPQGRLQALTVAWDTRPEELDGQRWFSLHPDEDTPPGDVLHWGGVGNRWNSMCAHCHSTNLRKNFSAARQRYETSWSELDVACEACHGPGSRHVDWAETGAAPGREPGFGTRLRSDESDDSHWVMDPTSGIARREPARVDHTEIGVCAGCHSRRTLQSEEPAGGRYLDHFRPALLQEGLYYADGQIREEVYVYGSFLQSRMYAAGVTCSDCHDAHALKLRAQGDALCGRCHAPARFADASHHHHSENSPGARCVECHMPARTYMQIDDRRDHSFRIPRPDLSDEIDAPNACNGCHTDRGAQWAVEAVADWYPEGRATSSHFGRALHLGRQGGARARKALLELASAEAPAIARATAVALLADHPGPDSADAIALAARDPDPLLRSAAARAAEGLPVTERARAVASLLEDPVASVRLEAARVLADAPAIALSGSQRDAQRRGLREYRAAQELDADQPGAHVNLAMLARSLGDATRAERGYRRAIDVGSYFVPAYVNLADLYREQNRDAEGEQVLRQGLAALPDVAELHHSLGLTLVRLGRTDEALDALRRASELGSNPRFDYVFAVALHSTGETSGALASLRAANERYPAYAALLEALVSISRDAGRAEESLRYSRELEALSAGSAP